MQTNTRYVKFSQFIESNKEEIVMEWVKYAQDNISLVNKLQLEEVQDHLNDMLDRIVQDMETKQNAAEQEVKSKGNKTLQVSETIASILHGEQRADIGFTIKELCSEFRALRASILRLWEVKRKTEKLETDFQEMIRFNEAIDELWMLSIERFEYKIDESKNWFIGILGHDLRNPLFTISGIQSILKLSKNLSEKERSLVERLSSSVKRMSELTDNLLELTNLRLGTGMTVNKSTVDLSKQSEKIVQEMQLGYPEANIVFESTGSIQGEWDALRLDQLVTNLITNALHHGKPGGPVIVKTSAKGNEAYFEVHNEGLPVPEKIRDMMTTGKVTKTEGDPTRKNSHGLGLFIVQQIVNKHKGKIKIRSTAESGTTFTIILPRQH